MTMITGLRPTHPGEILREDILPSLDRSAASVANALGMSRQALSLILKEERPVTTRIALSLGKAFGNSPEFWLSMQAKYDLAVEGKARAKELAKVEELMAA